MIYTPSHKPWPHQDAAEEKWGDDDAFALFMAMRTGKTFVVLRHYGIRELRGEIQNLCVIAPGGVYKTWEVACNDHFSADLKQRALVHVWESGAGAAKRKALDAFMEETERPRVLLMNVEALSLVKQARETILEFLKSGTVLTAIDESTIIGNPRSKRTKFINREVANESDIRAILSGLPTPRDPLSLYSQFEYLNWRILGHRSFYSFRARYAIVIDIVVGGRSVPIVKGFRDLDRLNAKIAPHSYRVRLEDIYDVPEKVYMFRDVLLTAEQSRLYKEMKAFSTAQLNATEHVTATIVIAQIVRLHQILCGHTIDESGKLHEIPENRTGELVELLQDYDGKAIIWCSYDYDVQKVSRALEKAFGEGCVSRFWGGNRSTREAEEAAFKSDPKRLYMVATPDAGGRGREWSIAKLVVYYSNKNDLEHRDQSEERPQAVGKLDPCTYVDLITRGTVEEKIIQALRDKIDMATAITGDAWRSWLI